MVYFSFGKTNPGEIKNKKKPNAPLNNDVALAFTCAYRNNNTPRREHLPIAHINNGFDG